MAEYFGQHFDVSCCQVSVVVYNAVTTTMVSLPIVRYVCHILKLTVLRVDPSCVSAASKQLRYLKQQSGDPRKETFERYFDRNNMLLLSYNAIVADKELSLSDPATQRTPCFQKSKSSSQSQLGIVYSQ
jgi:hypothetical protein